MPRRLKSADVKSLFEKYGYRVPDDFNYQNNTTKYTVFDEQLQRTVRLNYKNLQYRIRSGRSEYQLPSFDTEFGAMGMPDIEQNDTPQTEQSSFSRWLNKRNGTIHTYSTEQQHSIYTHTQKLLKQLLKGKEFTIHVDEANRRDMMHGFIEAAKIAGPKLVGFDVRLTLVDSNGRVEYAHLSPTTINHIDDIFNNPDYSHVNTSLDDVIDSTHDLSELHVEFVPIKAGTRKTAGFFPFINTSDIDMSRYGIFRDVREDGINESCLVQSLKASGMIPENDLNMLRSWMKTRAMPLTVLRDVCDLLKIHIYVQYDKLTDGKTRVNDKQTNHQDYGIEYKERGTIKLFVLYNHYILNERTNVSATYINRYDEINHDPRFKSHPRKMLLSTFTRVDSTSAQRYSFHKEGISSVALIKLMLEKGLLVPMSDADKSRLSWSYTPRDISFECVSRPVSIKQKRYKGDVRQSTHFFGYTPDDGEVDDRLRELQSVVDTLPLRNHIDVSYYFKFSELMQRVMYEYGCYDGVFEIAGDRAKSIRAQCVFPRTRTFNDRPLYVKKRLYYIDLNGAYMSAVESIPTGETGDGEPNTRVKKLIQTLYDERMKAKEAGKDKLAQTLKFMMNSCYGYSIRRPKTIKRKYAKDVRKVIDEMAPYIYKYSVNEQGDSGWVSLIESFTPHFTCPQFAKSVLDTFHRKMNEVKSLVRVLYENIDAILIDEADYRKLLQMGYIGPNLGQFKIEHVFDEIAIRSSRKYVAKLSDGTIYRHCVKDDVDYDAFVNDVKSMQK